MLRDTPSRGTYTRLALSAPGTGDCDSVPLCRPGIGGISRAHAGELEMQLTGKDCDKMGVGETGI